jgi:hypothetical protein
MIPERDLAAPMHDDVRLFANLYRPAAEGPHPVIMSVTPSGKNKHPDRVALLHALFGRQVRQVELLAVDACKLTSEGLGLQITITQKKTRAENSSRAASNASGAIWTTRAATDQDSYL